MPEKENESKFVAKLMRKVPRCLMQDMPRQAHMLKENFPHWYLPFIVEKYPRVLTQKIPGLKWHFELSINHFLWDYYFKVESRESC